MLLEQRGHDGQALPIGASEFELELGFMHATDPGNWAFPSFEDRQTWGVYKGPNFSVQKFERRRGSFLAPRAVSARVSAPKFQDRHWFPWSCVGQNFFPKTELGPEGSSLHSSFVVLSSDDTAYFLSSSSRPCRRSASVATTSAINLLKEIQ